MNDHPAKIDTFMFGTTKTVVRLFTGNLIIGPHVEKKTGKEYIPLNDLSG